MAQEFVAPAETDAPAVAEQGIERVYRTVILRLRLMHA